MHLLLTLWLALAAHAEFDPRTFDWSCETALAPVARGGHEILADFIKLPSGGELFVRIEKPNRGTPKGWVLAVHGLLESHRSFDEVTAGLIARGYGVVRPDLRGFARSMHHRHRVDGTISYFESVRDLEELLPILSDHYGVKRPRLVGHSMGGGLLLALLAWPGITERLDARHVIVNPYVYRNERYLAKKMHLAPWTDLDPWIPAAMKIVPQMVADSMIDPQLRRGFEAYLKTTKHVRDLDFNEYRVRRALESQVDVALGIVKGLRNLNSLHEIDRIPADIRVDMMYGDRDDVVEPPLARELARKITQRGGRAIESHAEHHIPTTHADELVRLIVE